MSKFIGKFGAQDQDFKDKIQDMHFVSVCEEDQIAIYTDDAGYDKKYLYKNNVHLLMEGRIATVNSSTKAGLAFILSEYLKKGKLALDLLDGSFTIVLWDSRNKVLYLCRDDGGAKLMYYFSKNNGLYFSNDLGTLVKIYGKPSISNRSLNEYLRFLDISPPYTIYKQIYFLEPEKVLSAGTFGLKARNKTNCGQEHIEKFDEGAENYFRKFEEIFVESIKSRIDSGENIGVFLSGGIDSSLVCAIAAKIRKDITAVTVGFEDPKFDESPIARNIANYLGIKHEVLSFTPAQDFNAFFEFTRSIPSPFADPAIIPTFQCFKRIGSERDLIFDGTGADTLIGIMPARHVRFILNYSRHIPKKLRFWIANVLGYHKRASKHVDLFDFVDPAEILIRWSGWTRSEIVSLRRGTCDLSHTMFYQTYQNNPDKTPFELYSMLMGALPDDRIHQSSSIFGPEVAFPFFDRKVQSYVRKLPMKYRYHHGKSKILFRALLGKYIPERIWDVPKQGFNYPFEKLLRYNDSELVHTYLSDQSLKKHRLFEKSILKSYITRFFEGDPRVNFKIWGLVMFQAWYENYFEKL